MKKAIISLSAVAALAFASSASALPTTWGGWQTEHGDNAASPAYWVSFVTGQGQGSGKSGDSRYCVNANINDTGCTGAVANSPVVVTGVFLPVVRAGCGAHEDYQPN